MISIEKFQEPFYINTNLFNISIITILFTIITFKKMFPSTLFKVIKYNWIMNQQMGFRFYKRPSYSQTMVRSIKNGYYFRNPEPFLLWGIIGINTAVFLGWQYASNVSSTLGDHKPLLFMQKHFTMGLHSYSHVHSFITSHFSHKDLFRK
jgi:hypothetical protein